MTRSSMTMVVLLASLSFGTANSSVFATEEDKAKRPLPTVKHSDRHAYSLFTTLVGLKVSPGHLPTTKFSTSHTFLESFRNSRSRQASRASSSSKPATGWKTTSGY